MKNRLVRGGFMLREYNALRKFAAFYYAANFACKC